VQWKKLGPGIMAQMKNVISTDPRTPSALVLVGIPGSGKSTFSKELCKHGPWVALHTDSIEIFSLFVECSRYLALMAWQVHVCQDELKTRKVCKAVIENAIDRGMSVIIDRYLSLCVCVCVCVCH
jgi:adenylate kinase family enzyme